MASTGHKKKWLALSAMGVALLLIPRRSSKKADKRFPKNDDFTKKAKNPDSE